MSREWIEEEHRRCREILSGEPQVLAGPIVRRADIDGITIFLATNRRVQVTATAHRFERDGRDTGILGETRTTSREIGKYLHVTIATLLPNDPARIRDNRPFPVSTPIGYDLSLKFDHDEPQNVQELSKVRLPYEPFSMPTLVLNRDPTPLLAHASCRKFHGLGFDAMIRLDDELKRALAPRSNHARPTALFLTGDQIYADDVPEPLIDTIIVLAEELMGYAEKMPGAVTPNPGWSNTCGNMRCGTRAWRLQRSFGEAMTSGLGYGRNQLLGFGEFAAAYLLAWSDVLWPKTFPDRPLCALTSESIAEFDKHSMMELPYEKQVELVKQYRDFVPQVRRALANISTYMIMDDHEVTDDWNISGDWVDSVERNYLARRVVSNAMAAYWCFQAQGNDPAAFRLTEGFFDYLNVLRTGSDFSRTAGAEKFDWTYVAPTTPPVLVLNTRTQRDYGKNRKKPPALMSAAAMERARNLYQLHTPRMRQYPLVVVSPVPVLGPGFLEPAQGRVGQILGLCDDRSVAYTFDPEAWSLNEEAFGRLLYTLYGIGAETCIILSGDVHYGCLLNGIYRPGNSQSQAMRVIQFTSSGTRNSGKKITLAAMLSNAVLVNIKGKRGDVTNPPFSELVYAFAGRKNAVGLPLKFMSTIPNAVFERNIGLISFEADGSIGCRFLTMTDERRTNDKIIEIPDESPRVDALQRFLQAITQHPTL